MRASEMKTETGGGGSVRTCPECEGKGYQNVGCPDDPVLCWECDGWGKLDDALTASTETLGKNQTEEPQLESAGRERKQGGNE